MTRLTQRQRTRKWPVAFKEVSKNLIATFYLSAFQTKTSVLFTRIKLALDQVRFTPAAWVNVAIFTLFTFIFIVFTSISNSILLFHSIVFSVKFLLVLLFITFKLFIADIVYQAKNYPRAPAMESNLF